MVEERVKGFVDDDDYDGALLVDVGVTRSKELTLVAHSIFVVRKTNLLSLAIVMVALSLCLMMKR